VQKLREAMGSEARPHNVTRNSANSDVKRAQVLGQLSQTISLMSPRLIGAPAGVLSLDCRISACSGGSMRSDLRFLFPRFQCRNRAPRFWVGSAMAAPKRILPPALVANRWLPGQSGNPSGHNGEYGQAMKLARQAAPRAVHRLIELMDSQDERVAAVACNAILDRGFGKPGPVKEEKDDFMARLGNMTREERLALMQSMLERVRHYLPAAQKQRRLSSLSAK
jgi:hypothetical protein